MREGGREGDIARVMRIKQSPIFRPKLAFWHSRFRENFAEFRLKNSRKKPRSLHQRKWDDKPKGRGLILCGTVNCIPFSELLN